MSSYFKLVTPIQIKDGRGKVVIERTNDGHVHYYGVSDSSPYYKQYLEKVIEVDGLVGAKVKQYVSNSGVMTSLYYIDKSGMTRSGGRRRRTQRRRRRTAHRRG